MGGVYRMLSEPSDGVSTLRGMLSDDIVPSDPESGRYSSETSDGVSTLRGMLSDDIVPSGPESG